MKNDFDEKKTCEVRAIDEATLNEIKESLYEEEVVNRLAQIFKALADPTRLKIIYVLSKTPLCVCDIADLLDMTQSAISHHLRLLRNLRLVKFKKEGKMAIYSLDDDHVLQPLDQGMDHVNHD